MAQANPNSFQAPWQGALWDLARVITTIRHSQASGRLTMRNGDRVGIAHLYFYGGKLIHIVGSSGDAGATLKDLQGWTHATIRFERGSAVTGTVITEEQEQAFEELLTRFQNLGLADAPAGPRVVEGNVVSVETAEPLLTPQEWRILIEATRRISVAVAHLVGPGDAAQALRAIVDNCATAFPAFASLQIASGGHLQIMDISQLDRMPRKGLLQGFSALIATCQNFCAPMLGEAEAHKLMIQALGDLSTALIILGVFQVNNELLASSKLY